MFYHGSWSIIEDIYSAAVKRLKAKTTIPATTTCITFSQTPIMSGILGIAIKGFTKESNNKMTAMILNILSGEAVKRFSNAKTPAASNVGIIDDMMTGTSDIGSFAGEIKMVSLIQPVALPM